MGLQKSITMDTGIELPEAYIKIVSCEYVVDSNAIIKVNIYKDYSAYQDGLKEVATFNHNCIGDFNNYFGIDVLNTENINIISQGYEWLKTLDLYKDAVDYPTIK